MSGIHTAGPKLTLVSKTSRQARKGGQKRKRHTSIFRNWIEQITMSMISLESHASGLEPANARERFRQLRRRFIQVQNEAYLCCITMEGPSSALRRERAAYRIPKLMWLMIRIRRQAEALLGVDPALSKPHASVA